MAESFSAPPIRQAGPLQCMPRATESSLSPPCAQKATCAVAVASASRAHSLELLSSFWSLELRGCPAPELCRAQPLSPVRRPFPFPLAGRVARNRIAVWELIHSPHAQTPCHGPRFAANSTPSGTRSREGKEGQELGVSLSRSAAPRSLVSLSLHVSDGRRGRHAASSLGRPEWKREELEFAS